VLGNLDEALIDIDGMPARRALPLMPVNQP
jgi:hypothetical protein